MYTRLKESQCGWGVVRERRVTRQSQSVVGLVGQGKDLGFYSSCNGEAIEGF